MKNETLRKLKAMKLPALAETYQKQIENEIEFQSMTFHERLSLLVDIEYTSRHNNNIQRLIHNAKFPISTAFLKNVEYLPDRHLNRDLMDSLADNEYIRQGLNVILIGATGSGKTYISCALGVNACHSGYKSKYVRLPNLFREIEVARIQGRYEYLMKQYEKYQLLILDEFLLVSTTEAEQRDLLELMEMRCGISSTIICSQFVTEGWHERLGGSAVADSILDRMIPSAYTMTIKGDVSMRKRKQNT